MTYEYVFSYKTIIDQPLTMKTNQVDTLCVLESLLFTSAILTTVSDQLMSAQSTRYFCVGEGALCVSDDQSHLYQEHNLIILERDTKESWGTSFLFLCRSGSFELFLLTIVRRGFSLRRHHTQKAYSTSVKKGWGVS